MSKRTSACSVTRVPGILCEMKKSLLVLVIMLEVRGLIAGTVGAAGTGSGGSG